MGSLAGAREVGYNLCVFTGLVHSTGRIEALEGRPEGRHVVIGTGVPAADRPVGASIAVSGTCLTVVETAADSFAADVAFETLECTTLGSLAVGDRVNLEPSLRVGDALGGHIVSGHVDGVGTLRSVAPRGDAREMWLDVPSELLRFIAPKGSICVDGVSLTVNGVDAGGFTVGIVPHTLEVTTLGGIEPGARVNLEVDVIARYVARLLEGAA